MGTRPGSEGLRSPPEGRGGCPLIDVSEIVAGEGAVWSGGFKRFRNRPLRGDRMTGSGGARRNSGPAPDPSALRRDRKDDAGWVVLPVEGFNGTVPDFPLSDALTVETSLWAELWQKPQAVMWAKFGMKYQVAAYVRAFLESTAAEASAGLKTAVLRMEAEIGLSLPGMHSFRWKFSEDEVAAKRASAAVAPVRSGPSAKDRLSGLKNAK